MLDPRFKLRMKTNTKRFFVAKLDQASESESSISDEEPSAPKKSKHYSFMVHVVPHWVCSKRKTSCEQELILYLQDGLPCDNPLSFWKLKERIYCSNFKEVIPATSAPVE